FSFALLRANPTTMNAPRESTLLAQRSILAAACRLRPTVILLLSLMAIAALLDAAPAGSEAMSPTRIQSAFSDADWFSMGTVPGANGSVGASLVDDSGNLYIGGDFTVVGDIAANRIAKWNG